MTKRILVVDDQAELRKLIRMTLDTDYEILESDNAQDALEIVQIARPQVVILDIMMPGDLDGLGVCSRLKSDPLLKHIVVILLTARGQEADREMGREAGADIYLTKPFSPLELIKVVDQAWR